MHGRLEATDNAKRITEDFVERRRALEREVMTRVFVSEKDGLLPTDGLRVAGSLTRLTDEWISALWQEACSQTKLSGNLVALGGYGRSELSWASDVDLVIEVTDEVWESVELVSTVERFMAWCREPRVKVAHAVRLDSHLVPEFENDFRTAVAYLDSRPLGASDDRRQRLAAEFLSGDDDGFGFVRDLMNGYRERLDRFGQTIYRLEPDLKNGPGSLRDAHSIRWGSLVRFGGLQQAPGCLPEDQASLTEALNWILGLRLLVHLRHGRKQDRLNFPDQEWLAERLGQDGTLAERTEVLMRRHYAMTKQVSRMAERLLRLWGAQDTRTRPLTGNFFVGESSLGWSGDALGIEDVFETLRLASEHDLFIDAELETRVLEGLKEWNVLPQHHLWGRRLLFDPKTSSLTSTRLLDLGILVRIVPEFEPLICHVQHDVYHVFTTDVHSVRCLEAGRDVLNARGELVSRWPALNEVREGIDDELFLAACLFHDIGKNRGGGHSEKGALMMSEVGPRLGFDSSQTDTLAFLVREHLTLSHVARRRDTQDPRLIRDLANTVRTSAALRMLTILTFCDMATVGDNVLTDWNASLLLGLFRRVEGVLIHGAQEEWRRNEARVAEIREAMVASEGIVPASVDRFFRDIPSAHIVETPIQSLFRQLHVYELSRTSTPVVAIGTQEDQGTTEVIVATKDEPGTLAKITGTISASGLTILAARIVTTHSARTLDIFQVEKSAGHGHWSGGSEPLGEHRIKRLEEQLHDVLSGRVQVRSLLEKRINEGKIGKKPTPAVASGVTTLALSEEFTVFEVSAEDRVGLLYEIASTLEACRVNIHLSKIDSVGTQVVDTFYVEELHGGPLSDERVVEVSAALDDVLKVTK